MFYEKYVGLCNKRGISPSAAAMDIGFSNAAASGWKKGSPPRGANLKKIADYFNVSVDYFSTKEENSLMPNSGIREENAMQIFKMLSPDRQDRGMAQLLALLKEQKETE